MMGFIMSYLKKYKALLILTFVAFFSLNNLSANQINLGNFNIAESAQGYDFLFEQDLFLNDDILKAVQKGIAMRFNIDTKIWQKRQFWFDKVIHKETVFFEIKYRNLLKKYELKEINGDYKLFATLDDLKKYIEPIKINLGKVDKLDNAWINVQIKLDTNRLPKPLQINYIEKSWNISSKNYSMEFKKIN